MSAGPHKRTGKEYDATNPPNYVRGPTLWLPHLPEPNSYEIPIKKKWYQGNETKTFWVALIGTFAAICVTIIYYFQLREMRKTTEAAQSQLAEMQASRILDERPWVGVDALSNFPIASSQPKSEMSHSRCLPSYSSKTSERPRRSTLHQCSENLKT